MGDDKRTKSLNLRLTPEEHELLQKRHVEYMSQIGRSCSLTDFVKTKLQISIAD